MELAIGSWHIASVPSFTAAISGFMPYKIWWRDHAESPQAKSMTGEEILSQLVGSIVQWRTASVLGLLCLPLFKPLESL